jgi:chromosome segregation ATPase
MRKKGQNSWSGGFRGSLTTSCQRSRIDDPTVLEATFLQVEDGLSKYANYIQSNHDRIPEFQTAAEAEAELRNLLSELRKVRTPKPKPKNLSPDFSERLDLVSKQRQELFEEEQRIAELKSITESTQERQDSEYTTALQEIEEQKGKLATLKQELSSSQIARKKAKRAISQASQELNARQLTLEKLNHEANGLKQLERQSQREVRALEEGSQDRRHEEQQVIELEKQLEQRECELVKKKRIVAEKQQLVQAKRDKIQHIMQDADQLESRLDEAVGHAGEVTEQQKNLSIDDFNKSGRPKAVIPSFLRFRRTVPEATIVEEEEEEEEEESIYPISVRGDDESDGPLRELVEHSRSMLKSTSDESEEVPCRHEAKPPAAVTGAALDAIRMRERDPAGLIARVEASIAQLRDGSAFGLTSR